MNTSLTRSILFVMAGLFAGFALPADAATFVVTNVNDSGTGSLRDAINTANSTSGADGITFNIAGTGLHTITLQSSLPTIMETVTIDGYSQPGSTVNTAAVGDNAVLNIQVSGNTDLGGFGILAPNCTIKGLIINTLYQGVSISGSISTGNHVEGCFIGTDSGGLRAQANATEAVGIYDGAKNNVVGGTTLAARNLLSGNGYRGVNISASGGAGPSGNSIIGNLIGVNATATAALPNGDFGIYISDAPSNIVGGTSTASNVIAGNTQGGVRITGTAAKLNKVQSNTIGTNASGTALGNGARGVLIDGGASSNTIGTGNVIAFNTDAGVAVYGNTSISNSIRGNFIYGNTGSGIKLMTDDQYRQDLPTPNDALDADVGPNNAANWPVITSYNGGVISGVIDGLPNTTFTVDVFGNSAADISGFGEGQFFLGSVSNVVTNAAGHATWSFTAPVGGGGDGKSFSATATTASGDTSEFGPTGVSGLVINTQDSGGGSLRNAIDIANMVPGTTITFNIPKTDPNFSSGVFTIKPLTGLPWITANGTLVDGASQKVFTPDANPNGPAVVLSGASLPAQTYQSGLVINASNCTVRSMVINSFVEGSGVEIGGGYGGVPTVSNDKIEGCYIGTDAAGTTVLRNNQGVVISNDSSTAGSGVTLAVVGGTTAAQRNIIAGNQDYDIVVGGSSVTSLSIAGNYVGVNRTGTAALSGSNTGIALVSGAHGNTIGGTVTGAGNLIVANPGVAIRDSGTDSNVIAGNLIGTTADGIHSIAPDGVGITIGPDAKNNIVGGTATGAGNVLAIGDTGILISGANSETVQGNFIGVSKTGVSLGGKIGVDIYASPNNVVGGTTAAAANIIAGCFQNGVFIGDTLSTGNKVQGNRIGVLADGATVVGNAVGVQIDNLAHGNTIGGTLAGAGNIIAGNTDCGVIIQAAGTTANLVQGNFIGTNSAGTALGNAKDGVLIVSGATANVIGASLNATAAEMTAAANRIANNKGDGVAVEGSAALGNVIRGNLIKSNSGLGINLRASSSDMGLVSGNDSGDADTGPNNLQNFPLITSVTVAAGKTTVKGTFNSGASTSYLLDLYDNTLVEPTGFGEGAVYVASQTVTTNSSGNATFTFTLNQTGFGGLFALTATKVSSGDTSEFSAQGAGLVVTNTLDSGPGSLRSALSIAKVLPGSTVIFNIPATDAGLANGAFTISPLTALPFISADATIIDGTTQTAFGGNTNLNGPEILIDGAKAPTETNGFELQASHCAIIGVGVNHFPTGIDITGETTTFNTVTGCFIGLGGDGVTPAPNDIGIFLGYGVKDNTIGGTAAAQRNVISGNATNGISVSDNPGGDMARNKIIGNFIGLNALGSLPVGNGEVGVALNYGSTGTTLGGTTAGERNVISGNTAYGIGITLSSGHRILGNYIGTNADGSHAIPNGSGLIEFGGTNTVGGVATGEANRIAFNRFYGISVDASPDSPSHVTMRGNQIYSNGLLGINLQGGSESYYGGVTANDEAAKDADTGPNGLQNYPVITGFAASGTQTVIKGTLTTAPSRQYALDFYRVTRPDDSGFGEGDAFLGSTTVSTNSSGLASFNFTGTFSGQYFAATATDVLSGDTSEFSSASATVEIIGFTPKTGAVGTVVKVTGGSFVGTTSVKFGGVSAKTYASSTDGGTLTVTVPAGAQTGPIQVTTPIGVATTEEDFVVTPPFNDNLSAAFTLDPEGGNLIGYNDGATKETGEPNHAAPGGASVWYKWTPTVSGRASAGIAEADFDTLVAVYTGTKIADLVPVVSNNDIGSSKTSAVFFPITAGKTYFIAVDGLGGAQGRFKLQWTLATGAPANDNFAKAQLIDGNSNITTGSNLLATREAGEPPHALKSSGSSVWYTWKASQTGLATFTTAGSTFDTLLAVYTGTSVSSLVPVAANDDDGGSSSRVDFHAVMGTTYKIAVDGFNATQGDIVLNNTLDFNLDQGTLIWTGAGRDGLWSNPNNWNLHRIPGPTDSVTINLPGFFTVNLDTNANIDELTLGDSKLKFSMPKLVIPARRMLTTNKGLFYLGSRLVLSGGTLRNNDTLEMLGNFDWSGGTWAGTHTYIAAKAVLDIFGASTKTLDGMGITNLGDILWRETGDIAGLDGASILNQKTMEISGDASLTWDGIGKAPNFLNDRGGIFSKLKVTTPPTATTHIGWVFGNDGQVHVKAGNLNLEGGGISYGDFDISLGARINVAQNYVFDKQTSRFSGEGYAAIINGITGFDIDCTATNFEFSQGQMEGAQDLSISNQFLWTGGKMTEGGTTTLTKKSETEISGTDSKVLTQRNLINSGIVNWSSGNIQADDGAKITNNGVFNCVVGTQFTYRSGAKLEFNNSATAQLTGSTTIAGNFTNLGHIKPLKTLRVGAAARAANDINDAGGLINITGDMIQGSGAQVDIVINGTLDPVTQQPLYGQILIGGNVNLKGSCGLTVTTPNYAPKKGDQFKVMRALSIAGDFSQINYPALSAGLKWTAAKVPEVGSVSYVLSVVSSIPSVTSFTPASGVEGALVTITGANLTNSDGTMPTVVFNTLKVLAQSATPTQVKVLIPAGATTGKISVITKGGTAVSGTSLVVLPKILSFTPTNGPVGTVVTLKGTTLISAASPKPVIKFNTTQALATDLLTATANQITVKVPAGISNGKISVTTSDGTATSPLAFTFLKAPTISSIPATGTVGAVITVKGKDFINAVTTKPTVKFGNITVAAANVTAVLSTQFNVMVPVGAVTGKITVTTSGGSAVSAGTITIG